MTHPASSPRSLPFLFISGGCRSGKSAYAQNVAESYAATGLYIATAAIYDEEMRQRVNLHQKARGPHWRVHEVSPGSGLLLWQDLPSLARPGEVVLLDCLTLWASGCMEGTAAPAGFADACETLFSALWQLPCPVVIVNSEVGMGVVPPSAAGRTFRDMAGTAAQYAAKAAPTVIFMVSGIPLAVKGSLPVLKQVME